MRAMKRARRSERSLDGNEARIDTIFSVGEPSDEKVDQFTIYGAYGELMHRFQAFELGLWQLRSRSIKPGATPEQAMETVEAWNRTTLGQFMRGLRTQSHWPDGLVQRLLTAIESRNYLAHHYLREYFTVERTREDRDRTLQDFAELSAWLDELTRDLDQHLRTLDIEVPDDSDDELAKIAALRRKKFFYEDSDDDA